MSRVASWYKLTSKELIGALVDVGRRPGLFTVRPDGEVIFNVEARAVVAAFCRVPEEYLHRAMPAWSSSVPSGRLGSGPAAWVRTAGTIPPTGLGCRACTARATQGQQAARRYLLPHARVCLKHQCWLLEAPVVDGATAGPGQSDLRQVPQIGAAQRRHVRLLRRSRVAAEAFTMAQAVVASWWEESWPEETLWPERLRLLAPGGDPARRGVVRDAVTYPEAVTLTGALADPSVQERLLADAGRHQPHALADVPDFVGELARRLKRPWLADRLGVVTTGPLNSWLRACVRTRAEQKPKAQSMWRVPPPHRPVAVSQLLAENRTVGDMPVQPVPQRQSPPAAAEDAAQGFARGLRHARSYASERGHLCAPSSAHQDGFAIGLWLANQRAAGPELAPERAAALHALDPWWNPPWNLWWQRIYYRAQALVQAGHALTPERGFPGTTEHLGTWLHQQCTGYSSLHPGQRKLLADLGITPERAREATPRRRNLKAARQAVLAHARTYADKHGHLCAPGSARQDGFALGAWLHLKRVHARRGDLDSALNRALTDIDPWWNPPWPTDWQREYHLARAALARGIPLDPEAGFRNFDDRTGQWLYAQCVNYTVLQPGQQRLLAGLGIPGSVAEAAVPNPAALQPVLETGLYYARSWAAEHGTLDVSGDTRHNGFPLGRWLARRRRQANFHRARFKAPWPHEEHFAGIDPYWNPPWGMNWQRRYQAAREHIPPGDGLEPEEGFPHTPGWAGQWLYEQCTRYDELHPHQQQLLARLGLDAERARTAQPRYVSPAVTFAAGLAHATAWAAQHGHLAAPANIRYNGFPLGSWLAHHRKRASCGQLPDDHAHALDALDPWWNPPWPMLWQRSLQAARAHTSGKPLRTGSDLDALPAATSKWLFTQCSTYDSLHPGQHQLLAEAGLTSESAHALAPLSQPPRSARPRLKNPPVSLGAGLPYAQSWAAQHGHLSSADYRTEHQGFPLGWWLYKQRRAAIAHQRRTGSPWPHEAQLAALDPWWNPPWRANWNRSYHQARTHHATGKPLPNQTTRWIRTQQRAWDQLHPQQQRLLTPLGIHGPTPLLRYNSDPAKLTSQPMELTNGSRDQPTAGKPQFTGNLPALPHAHNQHPSHHATHDQPQPAN